MSSRIWCRHWCAVTAAHQRNSVDLPKIPYGEKQCDIWTLARHELFCDDPPTYIKMPRIMRERWLDYAEPVRETVHRSHPEADPPNAFTFNGLKLKSAN